MSEKKIKSEVELAGILEGLRAQNKCIVTTNGSFDILHAGHVATLEASKKKGDILVVGVNSDASVKAYKSPLRPIIPEVYRARMVAALGCVDFVFLFDDLNPLRWLRTLKPNVHCNYVAYGENPIEKPVLDEIGAKLYITPKVEGMSTSEIIQRALTIAEKERELKR